MQCMHMWANVSNCVSVDPVDPVAVEHVASPNPSPSPSPNPVAVEHVAGRLDVAALVRREAIPAEEEQQVAKLTAHVAELCMCMHMYVRMHVYRYTYTYICIHKLTVHVAEDLCGYLLLTTYYLLLTTYTS